MEVKFYETAEDSLLKFAVIVARYEGRWVFCKHKERATYECPGGRREPGETISDTAKRELWEETGAVRYDMEPVCVYAVDRDGDESFGMLYFAEIREFEELPALEIERIEFFTNLPEHWTYPQIQPKILERAERFMRARGA